MAAITFIYGQTTLPTLLNRNAEGATDWATTGTHTVSTSATQYHGGAKSFKIVASGEGDATTNHGKLPSANNATFVVGQTYCVSFWLFDCIGCKLKTGGVVSSTFTTAGAVWEFKQFKFTASSATTDLLVYATEAATFYFDDIVITKYITFSTPNAIKGFDEPDSVEFFPALQAEYLDGGVEDKFVSFRRRITVDLGVVPLAATRKALLDWMLDTSRQLDYSTEYQIPVALADVSGFQNAWAGDIEYGRSFVFDLRETSVRTAFPV